MKRTATLLVVLTLATLSCRISIDAFDPPPLATPIPNLTCFSHPTHCPADLHPGRCLASGDANALRRYPCVTVEQLKNGQFDLPGIDGVLHPVQFEAGVFQQGSDPAQPGYVSIVMTDPVALGDLDGDGADDAAAVIVENYGGTGQFVSVVAFLNRGGAPVYAASHFVDDRALVNAFAIYHQEIYLDAIIHGFEDPGCCPNFSTRRTLRLWENTLALASFSSQTPNRRATEYQHRISCQRR